MVEIYYIVQDLTLIMKCHTCAVKLLFDEQSQVMFDTKWSHVFTSWCVHASMQCNVCHPTKYFLLVFDNFVSLKHGFLLNWPNKLWELGRLELSSTMSVFLRLTPLPQKLIKNFGCLWLEVLDYNLYTVNRYWNLHLCHFPLALLWKWSTAIVAKRLDDKQVRVLIK